MSGWHISYGGAAVSFLWQYRRPIFTHWITALIALFLCMTAWHWASMHGVHGFFPILWYTLSDIYREIKTGDFRR